MSTTMSVRDTKKNLEKFQEVCKLLNINSSEFLRECCKQFCLSQEEFLQKVGFHKEIVWVPTSKIHSFN